MVDLTALLVGSVDDPCRVVPYFWKPREHLIEHSSRDFGSGSHRYREWGAQREVAFGSHPEDW